MKPLPFVRYSLGAEELIELGRAGSVRKGHEPFLAGRSRRFSLGQAAGPDISAIQGFILGSLEQDLGILGNLTLIPMSAMRKSEAVTFKTVGDLLDQIPVIDVLLARIILLGNAVRKFALPLPGTISEGFESVLGGIAAALEATGTSAQNQKALDQAQAILGTQTDPEKLKAVLDATGVSGDDLAPEYPEAAPANPPPAGASGQTLGGLRQRTGSSVLLMFSR